MGIGIKLGIDIGTKLGSNTMPIWSDNILVNPDFDTDTTWIKGAGWTISGGTANYDGLNGTQSIKQNITSEIATYKVVIKVNSNTGTGTNIIDFGGVRFNPSHLDAGIYEFEKDVPSVSTAGFYVYGRTGESFVVEYVYLYKKL